MASTVVDLGWNELRQRRWEAGRSRFLEAVAEGGTAEAWEGLGWAAWWLDDAAAVFDARERAFRAYRERCDPAGAARMAIWLAVDHLDFAGAAAVARGWLARAERLLAALEPAAEHGWLAFVEGYLAFAGGPAETALARGRRTAQLGRTLEVVDLEMLGLALEGATLVACGDPRGGTARLDEATALALHEEAGVPIANAWTFCFMVTACTATLDHERAVQWCDRIAGFAERYGSRYMLAFCRSDYGRIHLWRGRWEEAEAMLTAAIESYTRSRPAFAGGPVAELAELRRRQGRRDEARALAERAAHTRQGQLCQARLALDAGQPRVACDLLERCLRQAPPDRRLDRLPAQAPLVRARLALGRQDDARAAVAELRATARLVPTTAVGALARLCEAALATAAGEHDAARRDLEDAVDGYERCGAPYEAALARLELASALAALGRETEAAAEHERARRSLAALGAATGRAPAPVTRRERDVLRLLADGLTNRQIAERLVLSEHTVHRHVTNILRKLDEPTRAAAAAHAVRRGLVEP